MRTIPFTRVLNTSNIEDNVEKEDNLDRKRKIGFGDGRSFFLFEQTKTEDGGSKSSNTDCITEGDPCVHNFEKNNRRKRKVGIGEMPDAVTKILQGQKSPKCMRESNDGATSKRKAGIENEHGDILQGLADSGTPEKVVKSIQEASYELEAKQVCQNRRGAVVWECCF